MLPGNFQICEFFHQLQNTLKPLQIQTKKDFASNSLDSFSKKVTFSAYFATFTSLKVSKIILSPAHFLQINLHMLAMLSMLTHKLDTSLSVFLLPSQLYFLTFPADF